MIKVNVLYGHPTDPAAFEQHYRTVHAPLAEKVPNVKSFEWGKALGNADGSPAAYFWIATLTFADMAAMMGSMTTPEGAAAGADVANFATGGVTMVLSEVN